MNDDMLTIEAALYATGRAMTLQELAELIGKAESTVKKLLEDLGFAYRKREGALEVIELPRERYVLQLRPELTPRVGKLLPGGLISKPTIETLMLIALKQPIIQSKLIEIQTD
ncbi:MAG: SMC-Scp complex subunit ScpB [Candidatus Thorarchaeota archaeon]